MSQPPATPALPPSPARALAPRRSLAEAQAWVEAQTATPLPPEPMAVEDSAGRVLAQALTAPLDVPAFQRAAMDGYALRSAEVAAASAQAPLRLPVLPGLALPARPYEGALPPGAALRIMTGAPLPEGLDSVVPIEDVQPCADAPDHILLQQPAPAWKHVGRVGEDIARGAAVLPAGRRLRPQDGGVAASLGLAQLNVHRRPRVRLLVTGNEIVAPGADKGPWEIYDANSVTLRGLIARDGALLESHQRLGDDPAVIAAALTAPGADVVLISGGSSVGSEDHAPRLLAELGELAIHGVAMRPAAPAGMGSIGATLVFLLPGNPVACLCAYDFLAGRALRRLGGLGSDWPYRARQARLGRAVSSAPGRVDYLRVCLDGDTAEPLALSGASALSSTTRADGFVLIPAESPGLDAGSAVQVLLYD